MRVLLLTTALLALAGGADAAGRCSKPYAPVLTARSMVTEKDKATARDDVTAFIAASDVYQACLARNGSSPDSARLIDVNQAEKERIGKTFNGLLRRTRSPS